MKKTAKSGSRSRHGISPDFAGELPVDSLAFSLLGASRAVELVEQGMSLPNALSVVFAHPKITPQAAGAIQDISYRTLRLLGLVREILRNMTHKKPEPPQLRALLYCSLSLLIEADDEVDLPYEVFTAVDQSVRAGAAPPLAHAKKLINAILRRFLREKNELLEKARKETEALWLYPEWWVSATQKAWPDHWQAILKAGNTAPPLTLRVNRKKTTTASYLLRLEQSGIKALAIGEHAVMLEHPMATSRIPGFDEGLVSVQDAAAQYAAPLLDLADGMRVLDACAAPGGKTGHILETADVHLTALDIDPQRLERVSENMGRLNLNAHLRQGDASKEDWWDGVPFDRILADVPCTASGIVRRQPDIRWLRRESDKGQLAALSARILDNLWLMLNPGGKLLFVTCSIWPIESEMQAQAFAKRNRATRLDSVGQMLPETGRHTNHDGFFYALFQKSAP